MDWLRRGARRAVHDVLNDISAHSLSEVLPRDKVESPPYPIVACQW
jgi:hypothetical protein